MKKTDDTPREYYAIGGKRSIHSKESLVGAARGDLDSHPPRAAGAVSHIRGLLRVAINPGINAAAGEVHAQVGALPQPLAGTAFGRNAGQVKSVAGHC